MYARADVQNRSVLPAILGWMAEAELSAGHFEAARDLTSEALDRAEEIGGRRGFPWEVGFHAVALARLGLLDEAVATAGQALEGSAGDPPAAWDGAPARLALGVAALSRDDPATAVEQLRLLDELKTGFGIREPRLCAHVGDFLEALVASGELAAADDVLTRLDAECATSRGSSSRAIAARGRAMLLAARGEVDEAAFAAEKSLALLADLPLMFERARTLLLLGQLRRRRREKRLARQALLEALALFEAAHTPVWVARTRAELERVPDHQSTAELTATEARVARLAAQGLTNSQIAERAFLSPKTVEVNLTRVYRKLGVRRAALAGRLGDMDAGEPTQS
jgi:DNA-binding CsgD family transcriptional regulator